VQGAGLNTAAVAKGQLYFGTATDNPELTDTAYVTQLNNTDDFGQITPGNSQKVSSVYHSIIAIIS
jgi:endo-1,4-beta-xylanase